MLKYKNMKCYVKYLNKENGFKETKKYFKTYEDAWNWILKTFDVPSKDYIYYY